MKLNKERNRWQTFSHLLKGTALGAVMIMGLSGTPLQANPALNINLKGCESKVDNGYRLETLETAHGSVDMYVCDRGAYVEGNMHTWAELDLVPMLVEITNKNQIKYLDKPANTIIDEVAYAEDTISFSYTVGGDFEYAEGGEQYGWNDITKLVLAPGNPDECKLIEQAVTQELIKEPGVAGGVYSSLHRQIDVTGLPPGLTCVAYWNSQLALGSHLYTGKTLHHYLLVNDGKETIVIDSAATQEFDKTMGATQAQNHLWEVSKVAEPAIVSFGDVCADDNPLSQDVTITVEWKKHEATPDGKITISTQITASNRARRDLIVDLNDTIYNGTEILDTKTWTGLTLPANEISLVKEHNITVNDDGQVFSLKDKAYITYKLELPFEAPLTKMAEASAGIEPSGTTYNTKATITDKEYLSESLKLNNTEYAAWEEADVGEFVSPYSEGDPTSETVQWISSEQSGGHKAVFKKTISLTEPTVVVGTLKDQAFLLGNGGLKAESSIATIDISSSATVKLMINKTIPENINLVGDDKIVFNFNVTRAEGGYAKDHSIVFVAGDPDTKSLTIPGLEQGTYQVSEYNTVGFNPIEGTANVKIFVPTCSNEVQFDNILADSPKVKVTKMTLPGSIDGVEQQVGWVMRLMRKPSGGSEYIFDEQPTTSAPSVTFDTPRILPDGDYRIVEVKQDGWFEQKAPYGSGCEFTIKQPMPPTEGDYVCNFTNAKYAKIVIEKETNPDGLEGAFVFTQTIDATGNFSLGHGEEKTFVELIAGIYTVTEKDSAPDFDLESLNCVEINTPDDHGTGLTTTDGRTATINLDWGETVTCTYTNLKRGEVEVIKVENGGDPLSNWNFTLTGPGLTSPTLTGSIPPNPLTFDNAKLIPDETYTLCETGVGTGWITTFEVGVAAPVSALLAPYKFEMSASNEDQCIDFTAVSNQKVTITVNNDAPGGEPRTIGYWKNWNTCTGGGQAATAEANGGSAAGFWLLNDVLPLTLGTLEIGKCEEGVNILNKSDFAKKPKKRASDAAYGMAAQLLAAKANYAASAETCQDATDAIVAGDALLSTIEFNGKGEYLTPKAARKGDKLLQRTEANSLAETLDEYNNGYLCTPTAP